MATTTIPLPAGLALYERRERITNAMWAIGITKVATVTVGDADHQVPYENDADLAEATIATIATITSR